MKVFGCVAYAFINSEVCQKMDDKSEKCIFIGYSHESKGYRLFNPKTSRLIISRDVMFDEKICWNWNEDEQV